jgi:hypothetical protein
MYAARQHMDNGGDVLWVDWEETPDDFADKAVAVGITPEQLDGQVYYAWKPELLADEKGRAALLATIDLLEHRHIGSDSYPGVLVVFDSMDMALTIAGFDPDNRGESTKWANMLTHPAKAQGATVVVIDAPTKNGNEKNPYPAGAGSKLFQADAAWFIKATEPFKRDTPGRIEVVRPAGGKERTGTLPAKLVYEVGDGQGGLPLTAVEIDDEDSEDTRDRQNVGMLERTAKALREQGGRKLTSNQLTQFVKGSKGDVLKAAKELALSPGEPFASEPGPNQSVLYWFDEAAANALSTGAGSL